ncbi:hypothetical protein MRX96_044490 [Rhipicephalus microplus]
MHNFNISEKPLSECDPSSDITADETGATLAEVLQDSSDGETRVDGNAMTVPFETLQPQRSTLTESTREGRKSTEPPLTETERKTETLSTEARVVTTHASDVRDTTDTLTVSVYFAESSLLPEDGLCDTIFYESFYVKNKPLDWNDTGLDHFFELGRSMQHTSIGASFSADSDELTTDVNSGLLYGGLDNLRTRGVKHFGMLNLHADLLYSETGFQKRPGNSKGLESGSKIQLVTKAWLVDNWRRRHQLNLQDWNSRCVMLW